MICSACTEGCCLKSGYSIAHTKFIVITAKKSLAGHIKVIVADCYQFWASRMSLPTCSLPHCDIIPFLEY